ncbi:hypothetical protein B0T10DRAFT_180666 [Thelonectria olida]|uniref:Uncharacterized protein n=1 Tax=Thelonectria olida TaxID=1576542 RepID=A0A9P8WFC1_9HYPO|nr:hypothetical protein B0T10DRAFT_180666 [Thelonectria olida]
MRIGCLPNASKQASWVVVCCKPCIAGPVMVGVGINPGRLGADAELKAVCWHQLTVQALGARLPSQSAIDRSSSFREVPCSRVSHLRSSLPDAASSSWATTPAPNGAREIASLGPSWHPSTTNIWGSPGHSGKTSLFRCFVACSVYSCTPSREFLLPASSLPRLPAQTTANHRLAILVFFCICPPTSARNEINCQAAG